MIVIVWYDYWPGRPGRLVRPPARRRLGVARPLDSARRQNVLYLSLSIYIYTYTYRYIVCWLSRNTWASSQHQVFRARSPWLSDVSLFGLSIPDSRFQQNKSRVAIPNLRLVSKTSRDHLVMWDLSRLSTEAFGIPSRESGRAVASCAQPLLYDIILYDTIWY